LAKDQTVEGIHFYYSLYRCSNNNLTLKMTLSNSANRHNISLIGQTINLFS